MPQTARSVQQVSRPSGRPTGAEFRFVDGPVPAPGPGTALVENVLLSVDPYMRENMDGDWELSAPLEGRSIGRVTASRTHGLTEGDLVFHRQGWRTHAVVRPEEVRVLPQAPGVPAEAYLGILGGTGLTAYVALTRIARIEPGETVYVSAAAGGVGSAAGQLARLMGAGRVVGSAGSPAKVRLLVEELGFDAAFDHREGRLAEQLAKAAPEGIDVYIDNVGGEHLEAAIGAMREYGRIAWCGAIAQYDASEPPPAPRNLFDLVGKSIRLEGFLVRNHRDAQEELERLLLPALAAGTVTDRHTVTEGFDGVVDAFLGMLDGRNTGKATVRVVAS
ncbi:NADP-dependent oxidoreductase [Streptomyces griseus]|uniref:zinc-binding dehydrogenase n=1 Tax=Streptomyces griseus TaxID=1911 RepID=UPI0013BD1F18|nr:NADP-dependent oxidoreductase [Streptomyces griseus]